MKTYIYVFADGTKSAVEVSDELYDFLIEMDKQEKYGNRRETRRHVSLESLAEQNTEPAVTDEYFKSGGFADCDNATLKYAFFSLSPLEQRILNAVYYERKKIPEIAIELGVSDKTLYKRYERIFKKIRRFF